MEEIFYEDILDTFLFCFIVSAGIIQIMVARRGWHGLSLYGGRLRPKVNYLMGAVLIFFGYAWYFNDPLHRNVRNIEAFMSLVCLVLGIVAAGAATAFLASAAEALRRRFGRGRDGRRKVALMERIDIPGGTALLSTSWGERGENMVVVVEPGKGAENLARSIFAALPEGHGMLSLHPHRNVYDTGDQASLVDGTSNMLARAAEESGVTLAGENFIGLGWGGNTLSLLVGHMESEYHPRKLLVVAPVMPDCERGFAGDALLSDTPLDIMATLSAHRPWKGDDSGRIIRAWLLVLAVCVVLATAVTVGFDVRWKLFSGPMVGLLLSLWVTYFLIRWRGAGDAVGWEKGMVSRLCGTTWKNDAEALTLVLVSGVPDEPAGPALPESMRLELWEDVLRGKFILDEGTPGRLSALIWVEKPGNED